MNFDSHLITTIIFAFLGGVLPALIWLFFWSQEDKTNPEPKSMLALAFIGGMVAVFISLFLEKYFYSIGLKNLFNLSIFAKFEPLFEAIALQTNIAIDKVLLVVVFAPFIEEISKFLLAYVLVLRSDADDEPLDPMMYLITVALGFAAVENMLFLINPYYNSPNLVLTVFTENMRFVGSTILHTVSSATIALFISFHFFDSRIKKITYTIIGVFCSIVMHGIFNLLMIGSQTASIFALELIWVIVIIILLAFEKIKAIRREKITN
jgi:RsiW-degrading membrane proteinase PrsW (M82 family)